jgi:hypothetical protein
LRLSPKIAASAYELYQQRARGDGRTDQDWLEAERETRGDHAVEKKIA